MSKIENREQLDLTIAKCNELNKQRSALVLELASTDGLINDLQLEILDYYDRGGNDDPAGLA